MKKVFKSLGIYATRNIRLFYIKKALQNEIAGRDCFVLGSAPEPDLDGLDEGTALICVNGSGANASRLKLKVPILTVVDFELLDASLNTRKATRSVIIRNGLLDGLNLGMLLMAQSNASNGGHPSCLKASYNVSLKLYKNDCRSIVHKVTRCRQLENDAHGLLSRGGLAIALCVWGGARRITFSGFTLYKHKAELDGPHYYASIEDRLIEKDVTWAVTKVARDAGDSWDTRNHSLADSALVAMLVLNGFDVRSSSKDFAPVLSNWGKNPPEWVGSPKSSISKSILMTGRSIINRFRRHA
jgi:hypothetical protein